MRSQITRRLSQSGWIAVLSISFTLAVTGQSSQGPSPAGSNEIRPKTKGVDEVEMTLAEVASGSAAEMKSRFFARSITFFGEELRGQAIAALPTSLHKRRITHGRVLGRVEAIYHRTLELHERSAKPGLFLYQDEIPSASLWRGCVLLISDGLADSLYDDELAGIIAHELGHSYFEDEMAAATRARDALGMRVVELKCDAIAILSLKLMNYNQAHYLTGLRRIEVILKRKNLSSGILQSHPELVARARFSNRFIRSLE